MTHGHSYKYKSIYYSPRQSLGKMLMLRDCIKIIKNSTPGSCQYGWAKIILPQSPCPALNTLLVFQAKTMVFFRPSWGLAGIFIYKFPAQHPQRWLGPASSALCYHSSSPGARSSPSLQLCHIQLCHGFSALPCANPLLLWCSSAALACAVKSPSTQNCSP